MRNGGEDDFGQRVHLHGRLVDKCASPCAADAGAWPAVGCESLAGAAGATRATSAAASFRIGARKLSGYTPIHSTTAAIGASSHNSRVEIGRASGRERVCQYV